MILIHKIQSLLWNIIASVLVVFIVEYFRRPYLKFDKDLIIEKIGWKKGNLWKFKISLDKKFFGYAINNLKIFHTFYDDKFNQIVKLQAISSSNPDPFESITKADCNRGVNLARGEDDSFYLIIKTNNEESCRGTSTKPSKDYWYLPCYDSVTHPNYKINTSEPSDDNEYVLNDGLFFIKISVLSDQIVFNRWFKLILKNEKAVLNDLNLVEEIKILFTN